MKIIVDYFYPSHTSRSSLSHHCFSQESQSNPNLGQTIILNRWLKSNFSRNETYLIRPIALLAAVGKNLKLSCSVSPLYQHTTAITNEFTAFASYSLSSLWHM